MNFDMNKVRRWARRTRLYHRERGIPLNVPSRDILREAIKIIKENDCRCPKCGRKMSQDPTKNNRMSLHYISDTDWEIMCQSCNWAQHKNK